MVEVNQEKQFTPKETLLSSLQSELQAMVSTERRVQPESATEELDGYFTCLICLQVVEEPQECHLCNALACKECIEKVRDGSCPSCR